MLSLTACRYNNDTSWPDIQLIIATSGDNDDGGLFNRKSNGLSDQAFKQVFDPILYKDAFTIVPVLLRPSSTGRIELKNRNPSSKPLIYPNYFDHPDDIRTLVSTLH